MSIYGHVVVHMDMDDVRQAEAEERQAQYEKQMRAQQVREARAAAQRERQESQRRNAEYRSRYNAARCFLIVWVLIVLIGSFKGCSMLACSDACAKATDSDGNTGFFNSMSTTKTWNAQCRNCMHRFCYNLNFKDSDDTNDAWADDAPTRTMWPFYFYCSAVVLALITGCKVWSMTEVCGYSDTYTCSSQARNLGEWMTQCDIPEEGQDCTDNSACNCCFWTTLIVVGGCFAVAGGMFDE